MRYKISVVVEKNMVKTVTELLVDHVHNGYHVTPLADEDAGIVRRRVRDKSSNGEAAKTYGDNRWMGKSAQAIIDHMKPGKIYHHSELAKLLPPLGLNTSSISPILSLMAKHGKLKRTQKGMYKIPGDQ